ncbi:hypothetical protein ACF0H5_016654 [Mactra antiquata]
MAVTLGIVMTLVLCATLSGCKQLGKERFVMEMDIEQEIIQLKQRLDQKDQQIERLLREQGSIYTRWGRTVCPSNGTELVYSGYMAGTYHTSIQGHDQGSGANYLCLAAQPVWDHFSETANNVITVTGVEYQFYQHSVQNHDLPAFLGTDVHNAEAPCAVCRSSRSTNVMIPGRMECYPGWTKEYSGYLVGAYSGYDDSSEYICLDRRPEVVANSGRADKDNMLFFVEARCGGSLECPPYVDNRELPCVVCSF